MENDLLREIVQELRGLRTEVNKRIDTTNERLDVLHQSVVVLQQGVAEVRFELQNIIGVLSDKVIWQNDSIAIATREGKVIYGIINKEPKK
jgi:uncharacterized protein involved in exopolysaccharide biosynthesis